MRRIVSSAVALALGAGLTGCGSPGSPGPGPATEPTEITAMTAWPYWPQRVRVHPLTRLVTGDPASPKVLEARIELLDPDGDTTKGVGALTLELRANEDGGRPVAGWSIALDDPEVNRLHYDQVTRTYLMRLELEPDAIPEDPELFAELESPDGRVLHDTLRLRTE